MFAGASIQAQSVKVQIIPQPKQITVGDGSFSIGRNTRIRLADSKSAEDRFAVQDFIDDIKATADLALAIGKGRSRHEVLVGKIDLPVIAEALRRSGLDISPTITEEGYVVVSSSDQVIVGGKSPTGTFYGLQTLKQLVRGQGTGAFVPSVKIIDWPTMRWRGVSDDISRGPVPTADYIRRQIRTEAYFKMNMHSFYMEHTFASESNPLIEPEGGSLTPAEIRELVAYAKQKPVGLTYVGVADAHGVDVRRYVWPGDRVANRRDSGIALLELLLDRGSGREAGPYLAANGASHAINEPVVVPTG